MKSFSYFLREVIEKGKEIVPFSPPFAKRSSRGDIPSLEDQPDKDRERWEKAWDLLDDFDKSEGHEEKYGDKYDYTSFFSMPTLKQRHPELHGKLFKKMHYHLSSHLGDEWTEYHTSTLLSNPGRRWE